MDQLIRSQALNNIPPRKLQEALSNIENSSDTPEIKNIKLIAINRYAESNIPVEYWSLKMEKDFSGDPRLKIKYDEYVTDIKTSYIDGVSICFAGNHGCGKTLTSTCILKQAVHKNYTALYVNLGDIVNVLTQNNGDEKYIAKRELVMVDFLVLDEWDSRFFSTDNAADLYARTLEGVFRTRSQNKLPTIMCTNSPNVIESFNGSLKNAIDSLMKGYLKIFPVLGEDYRKKTS